MNRYDLAVFDLDGTLLDTSEGVLAAVEYTISVSRLKSLEPEKLKQFIGPPIQESFASAYGLHGEILQELATVFRNRYKEAELLKAVPYPGIYKVFDYLSEHGIKTSVATYKREDYALRILKHFGFNQYSDILYGADHENKLKKLDIIQKCIDDSGISDYSKVVMIGDTSHDALGAKQLGVDFIGVTYGFEFRTEEDVDLYPNIGKAGCAEELIRFFETQKGGRHED